MPCKMESKEKVLISMCDNTANLSIPAIFSLFMDLACEHGSKIGLGSDDLAKKDLIWLTVKTKIEITRRPEMMSEITAETWPEKPGSIRCNRYYRLSDENGVLVTGKSEWAMLNIKTGRLSKISEAYPTSLDHCPDTVCDEAFSAVSKDFEGCEILGNYNVRSTDIDLAQHMNNAAYIKMIFGAFSCEELAEMNITGVEIAFRSPCFENDTLTLKHRKAEDSTEIAVFRPDGTLAATVRLT